MYLVVFILGAMAIYATCAFVVINWPFLSRPNECQVMAQSYGADHDTGPSVRCWISLRYPPHSQPLFVSRRGEFFDGRLTVTPRGLLISLWFFANFWRPPLLVPWAEIGLIGRRGRYEFEGGRVFSTFAQVPNIRMSISGKAMDSLLESRRSVADHCCRGSGSVARRDGRNLDRLVTAIRTNLMASIPFTDRA